MDFLKRAEAYAHARGDDYWFKHIYTLSREDFNVRESVRAAIVWLYHDHAIADMLEYYPSLQ